MPQYARWMNRLYKAFSNDTDAALVEHVSAYAADDKQSIVADKPVGDYFKGKPVGYSLELAPGFFAVLGEDQTSEHFEGAICHVFHNKYMFDEQRCIGSGMLEPVRYPFMLHVTITRGIVWDKITGKKYRKGQSLFLPKHTKHQLWSSRGAETTVLSPKN